VRIALALIRVMAQHQSRFSTGPRSLALTCKQSYGGELQARELPRLGSCDLLVGMFLQFLQAMGKEEEGQTFP